MMVMVQAEGAGNRPPGLEARDRIQSADGQLLQALSAIRTQFGQIGLSTREEWNVRAHPLGLQLEVIHGSAQILRLKLERSEEGSTPSPAEDAAAPPYNNNDRDAALQKPTGNSMSSWVSRTSPKVFCCGLKIPMSGWARTGP